jgi:hypothetical protein
MYRLLRAAERDLRRTFVVRSPDAARDLLLEALPALVDQYGSAAASLAADWYDEIRDAAGLRSRFRAIPAELPDRGRTDALARWAMSPLFAEAARAGAEEAAFSLAFGGLQRIISNASRETVAGSAIADPAADGWQRVGYGDNCEFCTMLIDRGTVYGEATADFASHDNCNCAAMPAFGGRERPVKPYERTRRRISDADRARVREYLRTH